MTTIAINTTGPTTRELIQTLKAEGQDHEWYPTTDEMIEAVAKRLPRRVSSIMDIGAGDGRVLKKLAEGRENRPDLFAIEKSPILQQAQPEYIVPIGTDFYQQDLIALPAEYIFCNPPYEHFDLWATTIIRTAYATRVYLVIPQRWTESKTIAEAIKNRGATTKVIFSGDFTVADRPSRAKIEIVEVRFPATSSYRSPEWQDNIKDPFDIWFDAHVGSFDVPEEVKDGSDSLDVHKSEGPEPESVAALVEAYQAEYDMMRENYEAIFRLDVHLLRELGVSRDNLRKAIRERMTGLKNKYWKMMFERLSVITNRLTHDTRERFLRRITGRTTMAFTAQNAYALALWAIQNANKYFDEQLIAVFRMLSAPDGIRNYKSNQKTWAKNGWRYMAEDHSHYALEYRIVLTGCQAIMPPDTLYSFEYPGNLHNRSHENIGDIKAVLYNLGYVTNSPISRNRVWKSGQWQNFYMAGDRAGEILYQVKAYKNGNIHLRFAQDAIMRLNIEAGRLLGWLRGPADAVAELGCTMEEASASFGSHRLLAPSSVKALTGLSTCSR